MEIPKAIKTIPNCVKPLVSNHLICTWKSSLISVLATFKATKTLFYCRVNLSGIVYGSHQQNAF